MSNPTQTEIEEYEEYAAMDAQQELLVEANERASHVAYLESRLISHTAATYKIRKELDKLAAQK